MSHLDKLLSPRTIAIVGASPRLDSAGGGVIRTLDRVGFSGRVYPINPRYAEVLGRPCYCTLSELPEVPDAVFIGLAAAPSLEVLAQAGELGIRAAAIHAGGFAEAGADGARLQRRLVAIARRHRIAVSGPNNMGVLNVLDATGMWPMELEVRPGPVAVIAHSGSAAIALTVDPKQLGLAYVVTAGNEAVVDIAEYLEAIVADPRVRVVTMFIESIRSPARFAAAARAAAARGMRIAAIKVGSSRTGVALVRSHTDSIAGSDETYGAFLRQCGVLRVRDFDEMLELTALLVAHPEPPRDRNTVAITTSGGEAALVADLAADVGLELPPLSPAARRRAARTLETFRPPGNPIDAWGARWDGGQLRQAIAELAPTTTIAVLDAPASGGGDALIAREILPMFAQLREQDGGNLIVLNTTATSGTDPDTLALANTLDIPVLSGLHTALRAIAKWVAYTPPEPAPRPRRRPHPAAAPIRAALDDGGLPPALGAEILGASGIPMAPVLVVRSAREAAAAAARLGHPVVIKGNGDGILHKHELDLVALGIEDAAAARRAFRKLRARLEAVGPERPEITVQPHERGLELILGARNDETFGPVTVVGLGGTNVEARRAVSLHVGPLGRRAARSLLLASPAGARLRRRGAEGRHGVAAAVAALVELSSLAASLADVVESIEINPLIVRDDGSGVTGVDLVLTARTATG